MKQFLTKIILFCFIVMSFVGCSSNTIQNQSQEKTETYKLSAFSMPLQTEYVYDYLGMRFQVGEEVNKALEQGKLFMYLDASYSQHTKELEYARQAILYVSPEDRQQTWDNDEQKLQEWKNQAQILGYIGAYKRDVLEQVDIAVLTNCTKNKNIGETPDGTWQYYISSNDITEVQQAAERFSRTLVTIYESKPFTEGVSIFAQSSENKTNIGDFQTNDMDGNAVTKDIFSEYDMTLVNVFTTQAEPCLLEIKELEELYTYQKSEQQSFHIVGIVYDAWQNQKEQAEELAKQIQKEYNVTYDMILPDDVLMDGCLKNISAFPTTFFVDRQGNIIGEYYLGARPKENLLEIIEELKEDNSSASKTQQE